MTTQLYYGMYRHIVWFSVIHCEELSSPEQREHTSTSISSARKTDQNEKKQNQVDILTHRHTFSYTAYRERERRLQDEEKREEMVKWMRDRQHKQDKENK